MTTGHLITDADFAVLSHINLRHLDDTVRQFVADSEVEFLAFEVGIQLFILINIIHDAAANEVTFVLVVGPIIQHHGHEVDLREALLGEGLPLCNQFGTENVVNAIRETASEQR